MTEDSWDAVVASDVAWPKLVWFGPAPFSEACLQLERAEVPVGEDCECPACREGAPHEFGPTDIGFVVPYLSNASDDPPRIPILASHFRSWIGLDDARE